MIRTAGAAGVTALSLSDSLSLAPRARASGRWNVPTRRPMHTSAAQRVRSEIVASWRAKDTDPSVALIVDLFRGRKRIFPYSTSSYQGSETQSPFAASVDMSSSLDSLPVPAGGVERGPSDRPESGCSFRIAHRPPQRRHAPRPVDVATEDERKKPSSDAIRRGHFRLS